MNEIKNSVGFTATDISAAIGQITVPELQQAACESATRFSKRDGPVMNMIAFD